MCTLPNYPIFILVDAEGSLSMSDTKLQFLAAFLNRE